MDREARFKKKNQKKLKWDHTAVSKIQPLLQDNLSFTIKAIWAFLQDEVFVHP